MSRYRLTFSRICVDPRYQDIWYARENRVCAVNGCRTKLSHYNPNDYCFGCIQNLKHVKMTSRQGEYVGRLG